MEFGLSGSLSHELFSFFHDGILAIRKPFSQTLFFFHNGILAIRKPFSRNFFFFHDGILAIRKPFSRTFFFTMEFWLSGSLSHELFSFFTMEFLRCTIWGESSFHIYITKSIYIGSASLKTLPLDLEPHLQGKE
jgi:hypothetical protein